MTTPSAPAPTLLLMCGIAFCGKTTLSCELARCLRWLRLSLDELNAERGLGHIGPEDIAVDEWERSSLIALAQIDAALAQRRSVILDDTNCFRWLRDRYRGAAVRHRARTVVAYLPLTLDEGLRRIAANRVAPRRGDFPEPLYRKHVAEFEPPQPDEPTIVVVAADDVASVARRIAG